MARPGGEQFAKRARERAREERREQKRLRRESRVAESAEALDAEDGPDDEALMREFHALSERHASGSVTDDDYAEERRRIFDELGIDSGDE